MAASPARRAAYEVVRRVREREAYGPQTVDAVLARAGLSPKDAALATRLARGHARVARHARRGARPLHREAGGVEPQVRDALRIAAYELLFARTPARAAVHQGVEAVRRVRPQAAGLANAVLRRLAEAADDVPVGRSRHRHGRARAAHGAPAWFVERLATDRGADAARVTLQADAEPAPLYLWHNPFLGTMR